MTLLAQAQMRLETEGFWACNLELCLTLSCAKLVFSLMKFIKLKNWFFVSSLFLSGLCFAESKTLVVGMELSYPPFEMTLPSGEPAGVSVDLAKDLAKKLGRDLKIENISFDGLIPALKTGKIDCIISSMTANEERAKSVDFSDAYLKTGLSLLFAKKSTAKNIQDLNAPGKIVAVKKGTTGHAYASKNLTKAKLLVLDKESAAVLEVSQGKADAFIYDEMSVFNHYRKNANTTRAELKPFREESWAVAVKKSNKELLNQINVFIKDYRASGGFEKLGDKYLSEEKKAFKEMGVPFFF